MIKNGIVVSVLYVCFAKCQFLGDQLALVVHEPSVEPFATYEVQTRSGNEEIIFPENWMPLCEADQKKHHDLHKKPHNFGVVVTNLLDTYCIGLPTKKTLKTLLNLKHICKLVSATRKAREEGAQTFDIRDCLIQLQPAGLAISFDGVQYYKDLPYYLRGYSAPLLGSCMYLNEQFCDVAVPCYTPCIAMQNKNWAPMHETERPRIAYLGTNQTSAYLQIYNTDAVFTGKCDSSANKQNCTSMPKRIASFGDDELFFRLYKITLPGGFYENSHLEKAEFATFVTKDLKTEESVKKINKIAWLIGCNLIAHTIDGELYFISFNSKAKKHTFYKQTFKKYRVRNFAVDVQKPYQFVVLTQCGRLLYCNVSKVTLSDSATQQAIQMPAKKSKFITLDTLSEPFSISRLWFYNDKIGIFRTVENRSHLAIYQLHNRYTIFKMNALQPRTNNNCIDDALIKCG